MGLPRLFVGEGGEVVVGFDHRDSHHLSQRKEFFDIGHEAQVARAVALVAKLHLGIFVERGHDDVGDAVAFVERFAHLDVDRQRGAHLAGLHRWQVAGLRLCRTPLGQQSEQHEEKKTKTRTNEHIHNLGVD